MDTRKRIYFASDTHLGATYFDNPLDKERCFVRWLDSIKHDCQRLYLLGDIFDFWFEYKTVVPRGFTRFLGKIAELTDSGIEVHWFIGNHDIWIFDYISKELGVTVHYQPLLVEHSGKRFLLGHGDGLADNSIAFKLLRSFFRNKIAQKAFSAIHPRWSVAFAKSWSCRSRLSKEAIPYLGEEKEHLVIYAKEYLKENYVDFFLFGHRHILLDLMLPQRSRLIITGDWISYNSFAVFDGEDIWVEQFEI
ncbi:MAG: UDP-2,3-diacylglucosamine diphosphatase [Bacteroidales bacterium]